MDYDENEHFEEEREGIKNPRNYKDINKETVNAKSKAKGLKWIQLKNIFFCLIKKL